MPRTPASRRPLPAAQLLDRFFWPHVDRSADEDTCWPWLRSCTNKGYGQLNRGDFGGHWTTHVLSYRAEHGEIPEGHVIDHTCHNEDITCDGGDTCRHRRCCNPRHLEAVTDARNLLRANEVRERGRAKPVCPQGHEYTEANTQWVTIAGRQARRCATCNRHKVWSYKHGHPWPATDNEMRARGYASRK